MLSAIAEGLQRVFQLDAELWRIVLLSLEVSLSAGPLGELGLLFTPGAMIVAQTVLILPIIAALARQALEDAWREYEEQLRSLGAQGLRAALTLLWDARFS